MQLEGAMFSQRQSRTWGGLKTKHTGKQTCDLAQAKILNIVENFKKSKCKYFMINDNISKQRLYKM